MGRPRSGVSRGKQPSTTHHPLPFVSASVMRQQATVAIASWDQGGKATLFVVIPSPPRAALD